MKEKEKLLSLETPLAFIFSHSALKEGWDNPNVFQICTLRDIQSERERRQTIGRGLRLCVDQTGARIRGFETNTLTVIATEQYEQFAAGLQTEIENATGVRFDGKRVTILNADERRTVRPRRAVLLSAEFKSMWDRIKYKSTYRVRFDNERLVADCIRAVRDARPLSRARLQWRKASLAIGRAGVESAERPGAGSVSLSEGEVELPDILTELQTRTQLTRKTIQRVLSASGRLDDFRLNPQEFIDRVATALNECRRAAIVNGIQYRRLGDDHYYAQALLDAETVGYVRQMMEDAQQKSVYDFILHDSGIEAEFAERMEMTREVKLFTKLPGWFEIPTPLGPYNPDWAVLIENDEGERVYFVVETKGSVSQESLRESESAKIACGREHFKAMRVMERPAKYIVARTFDDVVAETVADK